MPEYVQIASPEHINLDTLPLEDLQGELKKLVALNLVVSTFDKYENIERSALYQRWDEADRLYSGYKEVITWEGSSVARANFPYRVVFDQVESAVPAIREALFGDAEWFDVAPLPGGDVKSAQAVKARLKYVLAQQNQGYGANAKSEIMCAVRNTLIYGQSCLGLEFDPTSAQPKVTHIQLKDMYFDLGNTTNWVDNCRSVIRRSFKTVEELESWRGAPGITMPDKNVLWTMAKQGYYTPADSAKDEQRQVIGEYGTISGDTVPSPTHGLVPVLTYYSKEQIIVVLGRNYCIYSQRNPYGCLPFVVIPCYEYPNRFMAYGYADILWEVQRITEALTNGRLDEISLLLNPPRMMKDSGMMTPSQEAYRPGAVYRFSGDIKDNMVIPQQAQFGTNIWTEVEFYRTAGELRTGINGIAQGSARPGNVNRTAGGVSSQLQASSMRLSNIVYNVETYGIVPLLCKLLKFLQVHENPGEYAIGEGENGHEYIPTSAYYRPVTFQIKAASEMLSREKLAETLPIIMQNLVNGPLVQGLASIGQAIDFSVFFDMVQDAAGTKDKYMLVRPMTQQETAAKQQPPPQAIAMQQKEQSATQRAFGLQQMKSQTEIQLKQMDSQPNPMEIQQEAAKAQIEMALKQKELEYKDRELQMKEREGQMKLQLQQMKMQMDAQQAQMDMFLGQQKASSDLRVKQQQSAMQEQQMARDDERSQTEHAFTMRSMSEQSALEQRLNKDKLSMSRQRLQSTREKPQGAKASRPKD